MNKKIEFIKQSLMKGNGSMKNQNQEISFY